MKYLIIFLCAVFFVGASCTEIPNPIPTGDASKCVPARENLEKIGCKDKLFLKDGTYFEVFCVDFLSKGIPINPTCLATVETCEEINETCYHH